MKNDDAVKLLDEYLKLRCVTGAEWKAWQTLKSAVLSQPDVQQLKAEIAALATDLECHLYSQFTEQMYLELRKRMRQLSTV